jgi:hypothetical protein
MSELAPKAKTADIPRSMGVGLPVYSTVARMAPLIVLGMATLAHGHPGPGNPVGRLPCLQRALPTAQAAIGTLSVKSMPAGATVRIDGRALGTTPLRVELPAGRRQVRIEAKGFKAKEHLVQISAKVPARLFVMLQPEATAVAPLILRAAADPRQMLPPTGKLLVDATPARSLVFVDDKFVGQTPVEIELPVGPKQIRIEHSGFEPRDHQIRVSVEQPAWVMAQLQPVSQVYERPRLWTWVTAGTSMVVGALGVGLFASILSETTQITGGGDTQGSAAVVGESDSARAYAGKAMFGLSAALATTAAILYFVEGPASQRYEPQRTRILPLLGETSGMALKMKF